ncbi:YjbH domain-containing protein, partial [Citrobacter sp. W1]|uniref:YjbH domain-containing protein n=1 Tax=Citrobacter sp. W1 TaxID=2998565 RepID=UPI00227BA4E0
AYAFSDQGLDLYSAYVTYDGAQQKMLWLKVVNNRYREEKVVRDRIIHVLAALVPSDIPSVLVIVEADAVPCQAYQFRREDLERWRKNRIGTFEMDT